jgi:hypothetical protein
MTKAQSIRLVATLMLAALPLGALADSRGLERITGDDMAGGTPVQAGDSYALVIGVGDYTAGWPDLGSVERDVESVASVLEERGFSVVRLWNPNGDALEAGFEQFINAYGYDPENRLLFYFAGHGHTWKDPVRAYLVPSDAPHPDSLSGFPGKAFLRTALSMTQILAWARQSVARHGLFVFDSCFSGSVFVTRGLSAEDPPEIRALISEPVRQFITAGGADEEVPAESVFTPAFVDALRHGLADLDADGYITGTELGRYLQSVVPKYARQTPQFGKIRDYALARGDFVFPRKGGVRVAEPARPPAATPDLAPDPAPLAASGTTLRPPPRDEALGRIEVVTDAPVALVYLDGQYQGEAKRGQPLVLTSVPVGSAELHVVREHDYSEARKRLLIFQGSRVRAVAQFRPVLASRAPWIDVEKPEVYGLGSGPSRRPDSYDRHRGHETAYPDRRALDAGDDRVAQLGDGRSARWRSARGTPPGWHRGGRWYRGDRWRRGHPTRDIFSPIRDLLGLLVR